MGKAKWIVVIIGLLMVVATACVEDSVLTLEGPDALALDEAGEYVATISSAPPIVGQVEFVWWMTLDPDDLENEVAQYGFGSFTQQVEQDGHATSLFVLDGPELYEIIDEGIDEGRIDYAPEEIAIVVSAEISSSAEEGVAHREEGVLVVVIYDE